MALSAPKATPEAYAAMMADPAHRARLEGVMGGLIADYEWFMDYGTDAQRFQLMRSALPDMMRAHRAEEDNKQDAEMRAAYARLREAFQAHVAVNVPELDS